MANPNDRKFKSCGISPNLEDRFNKMFSSVVATGCYDYSPNSGVLPDQQGEEIGDSDDGHSSDPTESGNESHSDPASQKKRRHGKDKSQSNAKRHSSGKGTSTSPEVREL